MKVLIVFMDAQVIEVNVSQIETIWHLKKKIGNIKKVEPQNITLVHMGRETPNNDTQIQYTQIKQGNKIYSVINDPVKASNVKISKLMQSSANKKQISKPEEKKVKVLMDMEMGYQRQKCISTLQENQNDGDVAASSLIQQNMTSKKTALIMLIKSKAFKEARDVVKKNQNSINVLIQALISNFPQQQQLIYNQMDNIKDIIFHGNEAYFQKEEQQYNKAMKELQNKNQVRLTGNRRDWFKSFINHSVMDDIRKSVKQNPQVIDVILQNIEKQSTDLFEIIMEYYEEFKEEAFSENGLKTIQQQKNGRQQKKEQKVNSVQNTKTDAQIIQQLINMGFNKLDVYQIYYQVSQKNKQLALQLLILKNNPK